jgi:hypothetical protein
LLKIESEKKKKQNFFLRKLKMLRCALFENSSFQKVLNIEMEMMTMGASPAAYDLGRSFFSLYKAKSETLATLTTCKEKISCALITMNFWNSSRNDF